MLWTARALGLRGCRGGEGAAEGLRGVTAQSGAVRLPTVLTRQPSVSPQTSIGPDHAVARMGALRTVPPCSQGDPQGWAGHYSVMMGIASSGLMYVLCTCTDWLSRRVDAKPYFPQYVFEGRGSGRKLVKG